MVTEDPDLKRLREERKAIWAEIRLSGMVSDTAREALKENSKRMNKRILKMLTS